MLCEHKNMSGVMLCKHKSMATARVTQAPTHHGPTEDFLFGDALDGHLWKTRSCKTCKPYIVVEKYTTTSRKATTGVGKGCPNHNISQDMPASPKIFLASAVLLIQDP